jgi:hypothetical protein
MIAAFIVARWCVKASLKVSARFRETHLGMPTGQLD